MLVAQQQERFVIPPLFRCWSHLTRALRNLASFLCWSHVTGALRDLASFLCWSPTNKSACNLPSFLCWLHISKTRCVITPILYGAPINKGAKNTLVYGASRTHTHTHSPYCLTGYGPLFTAHIRLTDKISCINYRN